jgi:hypothetical protein
LRTTERFAKLETILQSIGLGYFAPTGVSAEAAGLGFGVRD